MINWEKDNDEHEEECVRTVSSVEDIASAKEEVKNHVDEMNQSLENSLVGAFKKMLGQIQEENFQKVEDGKLLKAYLKLDSYNKKLALIQEYQLIYYSTAQQFEHLNKHEEALQNLLHFIFKIMILETNHLARATKHTEEYDAISNL